MNRAELGDRLKHIREKKGLTTYKVAKLAKMQVKQVNAIDEGSSNYTIDSLMRYISVLDLNLKIETEGGIEIFNSKDNEHPPCVL